MTTVTQQTERPSPASGRLYDEAVKYLPGGTSRIHYWFDPYPIYARSARGCRLTDVDGVERHAGEQGISVRTGCFCNPGDGEVAHDITAAEMEACFDREDVESGDPVTLRQCQRLIEDASGKVPNTIRVSLGIASDFGDVWRFARFAESYLDRTATAG